MKTKNNQKFIFKNKKILSTDRQGFTFLELMIIISIIGIMTSAGLVSLNSSKKHFALKTAQNEVAAAIKLAQSYALQGRSFQDKKVCGYGFRFAETTTKYRIFVYYPRLSDGDCSNTTGSPVEDQYLKNGVLLSSPTNFENDTRIYFSVPSAEVSGAGVGSTFTLTVGTGSSAKSKDFTISSTGLVEED